MSYYEADGFVLPVVRVPALLLRAVCASARHEVDGEEAPPIDDIDREHYLDTIGA